MIVKRLVCAALAWLAHTTVACAQSVSESDLTFRMLPGDARAISHATSASRDTALLEAIVAPRLSVTLGSEFGLFALTRRNLSMRMGLFALLGIESRTPTTQFFPAPGGDSSLWRGLLGYELTFSALELARSLLGERGGAELALGYYHESDHHTAGNDPVEPGDKPEHPGLRGRPQIGNFVMADLALRGEVAKLGWMVREQNKLFTNGAVDAQEPYRFGIGGDLLVRGLHHPMFQPFSATFAEVLSSSLRKDARSLRSLLGVAIVGEYGELSAYLSFETGAQKGLLLIEERTAFGGGLRYSPFGTRQAKP